MASPAEMLLCKNPIFQRRWRKLGLFSRSPSSERQGTAGATCGACKIIGTFAQLVALKEHHRICRVMNNRNLSLAMLGIGGLGVLGILAAGTDRGRSILRTAFDTLVDAPERI